jgi:phage shock protein A
MNGDRPTPVPPEPVDDGTLIALLRAQSTILATVLTRVDKVDERVRAIETHLQRHTSEGELRARIAQLEGQLAEARRP